MTGWEVIEDTQRPIGLEYSAEKMSYPIADKGKGKDLPKAVLHTQAVACTHLHTPAHTCTHIHTTDINKYYVSK